MNTRIRCEYVVLTRWNHQALQVKKTPDTSLVIWAQTFMATPIIINYYKLYAVSSFVLCLGSMTTDCKYALARFKEFSLFGQSHRKNFSLLLLLFSFQNLQEKATRLWVMSKLNKLPRKFGAKISTVFQEIRKLNRDARKEGINMFVEFKSKRFNAMEIFILNWLKVCTTCQVK